MGDERESRKSGWREAFALLPNARSLWDRGRPGTGHDRRHAPVDGLRALSVLWVIVYHVFAFIGAPMRHGPYEPWFRVVNRGLLGVDVFFVISGFLIGGLLFREHDKTGAVSLARFYARRAFRILPAYWVSLALFVLLIGENASAAWANLLFVNDFLPDAKQCMRWTWSLAVEEQFYIVFPALVTLFPAGRSRLLPLLALFALSVATRVLIVNRYGLHVDGADHARLYYDTLYDKPYARFAELVSGAVAAHLLQSTGAASALVKRPIASVFGMAAALAVVAGMSTLAQPVFVYGLPRPAAFSFYAFGAPLFSIAVAYVIVATAAGASGAKTLGAILSWRGFYPVAQLSYSAYLLHLVVIGVTLEVGPFRPVNTVPALLLDLVLVPMVVLAASLPLYLLVERPLMNLRDAVWARRT